MIQKQLLSLFTFLAFTSMLHAQRDSIPGINMDSLKTEMAKQKEANKKMAANMQFTYFVIKAANGTYGYDVFANGNMYIHQETIPGISGTTGFTDTSRSGKTARFIISKILDGEIPPTVTEKELKKLGVLSKDNQ